MKITVLLIMIGISSIVFAQNVHVHKINSKLELEETKGLKIHESSESLLKEQREFQTKVFTSAKVEKKVSPLNFEEKEDLLKELEEKSYDQFKLSFPRFTKIEYTKMKRALYE